MPLEKLEHRKLQLAHKDADGYVIPLGQVNLVFIKTDKGLLGCGAFNAQALDKFNYPVACVRSSTGKPIVTIGELLSGIIKEANASALKLGIKPGVPAKEALIKL